MSPEISERSFEEAIECALLQHGPDACAGYATTVRETTTPFGDTPPGGYRKRRPDDYDRTLGLLPRDVVDFVLATQPKEWQKLAQHHGVTVKEQFLKRLADEIERRGALDVLRNGLKDSERASIPVPPRDEQEVIANFLERGTTRIDGLVTKVRDAINRLKELRTALISAAVTGKIDVREEVA